MSGDVLRVALAVPLPRLFDYLPPRDHDLVALPGCRVEVPFGRSHRIGIVVEVATDSAWPREQLKPARRVLDAMPLLDDELLTNLLRAADYWCGAAGEVLFGALPAWLREGRCAAGTRYRGNLAIDRGRTQRAGCAQPPRIVAGIAAAAGASADFRLRPGCRDARLARGRTATARSGTGRTRKPFRIFIMAKQTTRARFVGRTERGRRRHCSDGRRFPSLATGRRHRQRQDRSVFVADGTRARAGQADALAGAGNRPGAAGAAAPACALRCAHRGAAFQPRRRRTRTRMERRATRGGRDRAGHALGGVRAAAESGPDRGRRGTRRFVQAAGRLPLSRARFRGDAGARAGNPCRARVRHAVAGNTGQRGSRPLSPRAICAIACMRALRHRCMCWICAD